jgi:hypothetical protein
MRSRATFRQTSFDAPVAFFLVAPSYDDAADIVFPSGILNDFA